MRCKPRCASCFTTGNATRSAAGQSCSANGMMSNVVKAFSFDMGFTYYIIVLKIGWTTGRYQYATSYAARHVTIAGYQDDAQALKLARRASPGAGRTPFFL